MVLAAFNLLLWGLGAGVRRAARGQQLGAAWWHCFGFVVYFNLINLSQAWVGTGQLGAASALAALHGGLLLAALGLLRWRTR